MEIQYFSEVTRRGGRLTQNKLLLHSARIKTCYARTVFLKIRDRCWPPFGADYFVIVARLSETSERNSLESNGNPIRRPFLGQSFPFSIVYRSISYVLP